MFAFPGSFVGFFSSVAEVLDFLTKEWDDYGKKEYAAVFKSCSNQCRAISVQLKQLQEGFESEQIDPVAAIQEHIAFVAAQKGTK